MGNGQSGRVSVRRSIFLRVAVAGEVEGEARKDEECEGMEVCDCVEWLQGF